MLGSRIELKIQTGLNIVAQNLIEDLQSEIRRCKFDNELARSASEWRYGRDKLITARDVHSMPRHLRAYEEID